MKPQNLGVAIPLLAAFLTTVGTLCADESAPKPSSASAPTPGTNAPAAAQTVMSTPPRSQVSKQAEDTAQGRLQPTTPDKLIEKYGPVGAAVIRPDKVNPLQLINPFAPASYGGVGTPTATWSWNPMLGPGQGPLPRNFQDDRTHEPTGVVLSFGLR